MVNPRAMPFKLNFSPAKGFRLPGHAVIHARGQDASAFLQAQCMNDVNALQDGDWQYNGWLGPQGRVFALFYVIRLEATHFVLILPALSPQALIDGLKRFVFRSKVSLEIESSRYLLASIGTPMPPAAPTDSKLADNMLIQIGHGETARQLVLSKHSGISNPEAAERWHEIDIAIGWVWIDEGQQDLWTPHMLSLQQLKAFSLSKGCYPGQEIVARTHYLGKSKRALFLISGTHLQSGSVLGSEGRDIGRIVNASSSGMLGAAVLPADLVPDTCLDNGIRLEVPVSDL
jgi:folate-binding protein YgfZ